MAGIESNKNAAQLAKNVLDDVILGDIEEIEIPYNSSSFDCIIFADVLEHLVNPLAALNKVNKVLKEGGTIIMSIPNVQFYGVVHQLIEGNWTYQTEGILDETHLRFFTLKEIEKLVENAGLYIQRIEETLDPKYENFLGENPTTLKLGRISISDLTPEEIRRFFVFQYKIIAGKVSSEKQDGSLNEINIDNIMSEALNDYENEERNLDIEIIEPDKEHDEIPNNIIFDEKTENLKKEVPNNYDHKIKRKNINVLNTLIDINNPAKTAIIFREILDKPRSLRRKIR